MTSQYDRTAAEFDQTNWSLVNALKHDDPAAIERAQEHLAKTYWPPIYACARRLTSTREDATDLTQAFFTDIIFERRLFEQAVADRGRLRSLLRSALRHFAIDQWRRERARGHTRLVPLERLEHEDTLLDEHRSDPDDEFDRRWAMVVLERALVLCESHFCGRGMENHWKLFECRIIFPASRGVRAPSVRDLAARFDFESVPQASAAIQTVKRRLDVLLRQVVCETVSDPVHASDEHAYILRVLHVRN